MTGIATVTNTIAPTFSQPEREANLKVELLFPDLCPAMVLKRDGTGWVSVGYAFKRAPSWEVADGAGSRSLLSWTVSSAAPYPNYDEQTWTADVSSSHLETEQQG
ncbi:predicted protein [Aspergillus nidulans FGSC A4]|uniref:Uncharacterized protein n=1 Tax=Emericella nidulans (strain FGSC A4 / ATCC 38163 / CBS 112.46 / NRRL 194 / M139) TaxID=227321 RepID=Q5AZC5_EMENI|nr:hypothetical protein [Aspergillus nidulans FGSC A4]EAA58739.1 predicted protein [Aspergillus nidulans FGSC A4]CBF69637.1 TPA: hypothetical protein ANIA_06355 [Aspergillus nidulans FGSC A4]|eukprot:XP_663959.1 predicted protein [Aspergillus nidulans FGSC A4]